MKYIFALFILVITLVSVHSQDDGLNQMIKQCIAQEKLSESEAGEIVKQIPQLGGSSPTNNFKCFIACIMEQTRQTKPDGTANSEGLLSAIAEKFGDDKAKVAKLQAVVKNCVNKATTGAGRCEKAFIYFACTNIELAKSAGK